MSTFAVTIRKLSRVWPHPNADRLELASVEGCEYQFVIPKDQYKQGDEVVFFPIDSVLPQGLIAKMGLAGKLAGKDKNRIKTVKLRGSISQGIVARPTDVFADDSWKTAISEQITAALGVIKYDPPPVPCHTGNLVMLPPDIPVYDIEGADNYPAVVAALMDVPVYVTEKLEGSQFWLAAERKIITFGQHHRRIEPIPGTEHNFIIIAQSQGLVELAKRLSVDFGGQKVTLRGEYCGPGVQKNIYRLREGHIYLFDILVSKGPGDYRYFSPNEFVNAAFVPDITVPLLAMDATLRSWLDGKSIRDASNGVSVLLTTQKREGIVIKPMTEGRNEEIGRLVIKQRSPEYLVESDS